MSEELVLYAIVSAEAVAESKGARGKMAAQTGHAFCGALCDAIGRFHKRAAEYIESGATPKLVLVAEEATLHKLHQLYKDKFGTALVKDAGRTVFTRPIITALGIGPMLRSERDEILAELRPWQ